MIGYHKEFNWGGKGMYFKASDKKLFKKYTKLWKKISDLVGNELYNNMYYENNEKDIRYINSRISIINGEIETTFYNNFNKNVEPKENVTYDCFSLIDLNSTNEKINDDNDYVWYPEVYLKECQYKKKIKKKKFLNKVFKSDSSDNEANNGADSEPDSDLDDNNMSGKSSKESDNNESEKSSKKFKNKKSKMSSKKSD